MRILQVVDEDDLGLYSAIREHFLRVVLLTMFVRLLKSIKPHELGCFLSPFTITVLHSLETSNQNFFNKKKYFVMEASDVRV